MSQWETMSTFSNKYCISLRDKYGFIPVNVQQQTSAKEQVESNFKGTSVTEKLEPSLDGLANNKETQRDANIVLGLFSPARYKITEHRTYDITFWDNFYRSMHILKDRDGESNGVLSMFFDGAVDYFEELPSIDNVDEISNVMQRVLKLKKR